MKTFEYLTVNDVATLLKCDRRTGHHMIKLGRLNAINLSTRKTRVLKKDLDGMFLNPITEVNTKQPLPDQDKRPALKDCYTVGQILAKYSLAEVTLRKIISKNNIAKYKEGKFVYIKKQTIDPILKRFDIRHYIQLLGLGSNRKNYTEKRKRISVRAGRPMKFGIWM